MIKESLHWYCLQIKSPVGAPRTNSFTNDGWLQWLSAFFLLIVVVVFIIVSLFI